MQLIRRSSKPNMEQISSNLFLVRTQAGFRRAFKTWYKEYFGCKFNTPVSSTYKDAISRLEDYPKKYPAKVVFSYQSHELLSMCRFHVDIYHNSILGWIKVLSES